MTIITEQQEMALLILAISAEGHPQDHGSDFAI